MSPSGSLQVKGLPPPFRTPLVREGGVWIKIERGQHSESAKYRMVYSRLQEAIKAGDVGPGKTLVEVTSGSTGAALAYAGRKLGYRVDLHAYRTARPEKCDRMRDLGARLFLHPVETPMSDLLGRVAASVEAGTHWHLNQYDGRRTAGAYAAMAQELIEQIEASRFDPRLFVCPVGTGGLIQGLGGPLRAYFPNVEILAVEPVSGVAIDGMRNTESAHLGDLDPYDREFPDNRVVVPPPLEAALVDTLPVGPSSTVSINIARAAGREGTVVLAPD